MREGLARSTGPTLREPTPGWAGQRIFGSGNDWEPATAADPAAPYVYMLTTRYSGPGPLPCPKCDLPALVLKVSADGGQTFGGPIFIPPSRKGGQYDPQIVTDQAGEVFVAFIDGGFDINVTKSIDHGATWSPPVIASVPASYGDHPWLGVSADGSDLYIGFNQASSWVAQSHNGGVTWRRAVQTSHTPRFFFANGAVVAPDGTVAISQASYRLNGRRPGAIQIVVTRSTNNGSSWRTTVVDAVGQQPPCENPGCPEDHYGGHAALGVDDDGRMLLAYDGATVPYRNQYIFIRTSDDGGATWSARRRISPGGGITAGFVSVAGRGHGDFRVVWQDNRRGPKRWNTYTRRTTDGGVTWKTEFLLSDARSGRGYKHRRGYDADYGDYTEVTVSDSGKTFAVWGEGFSYNGPGGTWYNRQV